MQAETELTAAWLAEHIMGWTELPRDVLWSGRDSYPVFRWDGEDLCVCHGLHIQAFNPLEDIADAWQVVEAIQARAQRDDKPYKLELVSVAAKVMGPSSKCRLTWDSPYQHALTAPEAICHAAYDWWLEHGQEQAG